MPATRPASRGSPPAVPSTRTSSVVIRESGAPDPGDHATRTARAPVRYRPRHTDFGGRKMAPVDECRAALHELAATLDEHAAEAKSRVDLDRPRAYTVRDL